MNKPIAIIAGEPNSISSEIIFKSWKLRKKFNHKLMFVIGSYKLLNLQKKKLNSNIKIKIINNNFKINDLKGSVLPIYNIEYKQKKAFEKISTKSNKYIFRCFEVAINLFKKNKIFGFINCPISKESLFKKKHQGITEFLTQKSGKKSNGVMLIYNKKLSVSPITTHIPLTKVSEKLNKSKIIHNVKVINNFYKNIFNIKPKIAILGLNPHNFSSLKKSEEKEIINKAIRKLIKLKIKVLGPISPDSSFMVSMLKLLKRVWQNILFYSKLSYRYSGPIIPPTLLRKRVLDIIEKSDRIYSVFIRRNKYQGGVSKRDYSFSGIRKEFYQNIDSTGYTLCIRGTGNFSARFYETLALGRIPIFINTDCMLPFNDVIDWKKHVLWIEQREISDIETKILDFHNGLTQDSFASLQIRNRKLWEDYFSFSGFINNLTSHLIRRIN